MISLHSNPLRDYNILIIVHDNKIHGSLSTADLGSLASFLSDAGASTDDAVRDSLAEILMVPHMETGLSFGGPEQ